MGLHFTTRSLAVVGVLIITGSILATTYGRDADKISEQFDIACHTPGAIAVPEDCDEMFTDIPLCGEVDCSDQWPYAGYVIDADTGLMYFTVPDYPVRESPQRVG